MDATTHTSLNSDEILHIIATWPVEEQVRLAEAIVTNAAQQSSTEHQRPQPSVQPPQRSTWDALYGAAANTNAPPTDEQVTQWLEEWRMQKYGSR